VIDGDSGDADENGDLELIAVFVLHSYEKVSMVEFGCLVKQFFGVCALP